MFSYANMGVRSLSLLECTSSRVGLLVLVILRKFHNAKETHSVVAVIAVKFFSTKTYKGREH